jgi:hypothetical protein
MKNLSAANIANDWANKMAASGDKIRQGVQSVTESPTEKAALATDRMVAGIQRAAAEGKIQAGLRRVTLEDWRKAMIDKGVGRVGSGAMAAKPKFQDFMGEFIPWLEAGQRALESTPRGDTETNIQRAVAMMRHNSQFRRTRR